MTFNRMMVVQSSRPPIVEIDTGAASAYVRFKRAEIAKTVSREAQGVVVAVDLDKSGEVIGVELIGVHEFGVGVLLRRAQIQAPRIDLSKARYVRPGIGVQEPVGA